MEKIDNATEQVQFATFTVAGLHFGVELKCVQELIRYQEMTDIPLAAPSVRGLINLRGQIVIAIDARRALGLPEGEAESLPMNVVMRSTDGCTSLLVDQIGDVVTLRRATLEATPENMPACLRSMVLGVYVLSERLLLIPDLQQLMN